MKRQRSIKPQRRIETFTNINHTDIFLISETHFTKRTYFNINGFNLIPCNHPDNRVHGDSAILVKRPIKYTILDDYEKPKLQAAGIRINCNNNDISIYSIYFLPRYNIKHDDDYQDFFEMLATKFIVGGDFNTKHPCEHKRKDLYKNVIKNRFLIFGRPTYWSSDPRKIPNVLDFVIYIGIPALITRP